MRHRLGMFMLLLAGVLLAGAVTAHAQDGTKLLRSPSISEDYLAFVYAGDIWLANRDGSDPRRLTVHEGLEGSVYLSPDGKWVAFSAEYDGNVDAFVVSPDGGSPRRMTYHPEADIVRGWTPDGRVMFNSTRESETRRYGKFFAISPDGGPAEALILPRAARGSFSPDGGKIAYTMLPDPFGTWKRYRGGLAPFIWIFDMKSHEVVMVPRKEYSDPVTEGATHANDTWPVWLGDKVYFLSDRGFTMNIFEYDPKTESVRQLTEHDTYDVKSLKGQGSTLVYEQAGMIHELNTATGESRPVPVHINPDLPDTRPHFTNVSGDINWYEISPTGKRMLVSARGEVWTVPAEEGPTRNISSTPATHERYPVWSPKGDKIAYMSDASGEYKLHLVDQKGGDDPEIYDLAGDANFYFLSRWSPDGNKLLYTDNLVTLYYFDFEKEKSVKVAEDTQSYYAFDPSWSQDSRYVTYTTYLDNEFRAIWVYDLESGDRHQITDGMSYVNSPAFSRDNKYLYFTASTDIGMLVGGSEMSSYGREYESSLYMAVLQADESTPFAPESDEEEVSSDEEDDEEKDDDDDDGEDDGGQPEIDFDGIGQRIVSLPVDEGLYYGLKVADGGALFFLSNTDDGNTLMKFNLDDEEAEEYMSGVRAYEISADGKKVLVSTGGSYSIVDAAGKPSPGDGSVDVSGMRMQVYPRDEWAQMFREAWRLERDFFYDPDMHGNDWDAVYEKYQPFVEHIGHRSDLNYLIGELIGELVVGHAYRWGGDMPDVDRVTVGLLGADYERKDGRYRFKDIFSGLNWNADERSPLTEPGVMVKTGEYLLAVNGHDITADDNLYTYFQDTAGKQTVLTINDRPDYKGAREVTVEPLRSERALRLRNWVDDNQKKVWDATDGRAAYVYMPNTAGAGYTFFTRYFFSQLDKHGVIIDERFNGGGHIADFVVDMLDRPIVNWWTNRAGTYGHSPTAAIFGPKVMITNENAGSGGDWLPYAFKKRQIGTIVGTRTWGGLVGIGGIPNLIDGGAVTVPNFAFFSEDGRWAVENYGVAPDIYVQQTPKKVIAGHDPQLEKAIEVINEQLKDYEPPTPDHDPFPKRAEAGRKG